MTVTRWKLYHPGVVAALQEITESVRSANRDRIIKLRSMALDIVAERLEAGGEDAAGIALVVLTKIPDHDPSPAPRLTLPWEMLETRVMTKAKQRRDSFVLADDWETELLSLDEVTEEMAPPGESAP